ncbi:hypothetical protein DNTS_004406, partial [Danionella cerebrum]
SRDQAARLAEALLRDCHITALLKPRGERDGEGVPAYEGVLTELLAVFLRSAVSPEEQEDGKEEREQREDRVVFASPDGVVYDTHSKVVMSQGGTFEKMKEKITAVRAVVPNKSNNEIALVLQHFENSVDCAVQAFVEGTKRVPRSQRKMCLAEENTTSKQTKTDHG